MPDTPRYTDIGTFKQYVQPPITSAQDDVAINQAILRAESEIDLYCGTSFNQQTITQEVPRTAWVDGKGMLWVISSVVGPITQVNTLQVKDMLAAPTTWQTISFDPVNGIIYPNLTSPPKPTSWTVIIQPTPPLWPRAAGDMYVRWGYTGGYATIPTSLQGIATRLAFWIYKMREAPVSKVVTAELGLMSIPLSIPPDIKADLFLWRRVTAG